MEQRNYNGERFKTLTVAELRELLSDRDDNELVIFSTDYGDYHHTPQALGLRGELEEVQIGKSGYSNSGFEVLNPEDEKDEEISTYLLIR